VRNLTENEEGIDLVYAEMGSWVLLERVMACMSSGNEDVVLEVRFFFHPRLFLCQNTQQASSVLANLANGPQAPQLLTHPRVLSALHAALVSTPPKTDTRRPVVACIAQLAQVARGSGRATMKKVGFEEALRNVCEWGSIGGAGGVGGGGGNSNVVTGGSVVGGRGAGPLGVGMERDRDVVEQAKLALHFLEFID